MKSLLVKIASFAVMFHMTFGCSLHHGLGTTACAHQHTTDCGHEHDAHAVHEGHEHDDHDNHDPQQPASDPMCDDDGTSHAPCHVDCCDDGCNALQFVKFQFESLDFWVPYFDHANNLAVIESQSCVGFSVDPFPDWLHTKTSLRAHLLFGVQII